MGVLSAALLLLLLLLPGPLAAQEEGDPLAPPSREEPGEPASPEEEARLREETARLAVELARRVTHPASSWVRLRVEFERAGAPFDRARRFDVSRREDADGVRLRIYFHAPHALRGEAWLFEWDPAGRQRVWRYDPEEQRVERATPREPTWPVGDTALTLQDLRGPALAAHRYSLEREGRLAPDGTAEGEGARDVLVVEARPRRSEDGEPAPGAFVGAARRLLWIDRELHAPLRVEDRGPQGRVLRTVERRFSRGRSGRLRCAALRLTTPPAERVDRVAVESFREGVPAAHFDPDRFGVE